MKLPADVQFYIDKLHFVKRDETDQEIYREGFNAGFAAFRDSEMVKKVKERLRVYARDSHIGSPSEQVYSELLKWVGDET